MIPKAITVFNILVLVMLAWTQATAQDRRPAKKSTVSQQFAEAPASFDNKGNGMVDDQTHQADRLKFDSVEEVADGLGPLYNAQSCRECHQNPTSGGGSQIHRTASGAFGTGPPLSESGDPDCQRYRDYLGPHSGERPRHLPECRLSRPEIQERVPDSESIRTTRMSLSLLGDGFVEAVSDRTLIDLARNQCKNTHGKVCGLVIYVPIVEAPGQAGVGRFGWKNQHASLLSFSGDAYLNEMGITTRLFPDEVTKLCNTVSEPNDKPGPDGMADVDHFARFIRALEAPARDPKLADTPWQKRGRAVRQSRLRSLPRPDFEYGAGGTRIQWRWIF